MILASQAQPDRIYRSTTPEPGCFYTKPRRLRPRQYVDRLVIKGDALGGFWFQVLKANPDAVLMQHHHRGVDMAGNRWEITRSVLMPPGEHLRESQTRPGYGGAK